MEEFNNTLSILSLVVAAVSSLVIGAIWYNPKVFGTAWMKASGVTEEQAKNMNPVKTYGIAVVLAFLAAFMLSTMVLMGGTPDMPHGPGGDFMTFKHGALHGTLAALFLVMPAMAVNALFEGKSFKYILINVGYWVVTFAVMAGIINMWPA